MIDAQVPLIVRVGIGARARPVIVGVVSVVGHGIVAHHLRGHRVNQVAGDRCKLEARPGQLGVAGAGE